MSDHNNDHDKPEMIKEEYFFFGALFSTANCGELVPTFELQIDDRSGIVSYRRFT